MSGERGQASIEWIGAVLLIALTLGAVTRVAARVDGGRLATALEKAPICAAKAGCPDGAEAPADEADLDTEASITAPPLVPLTLRPEPRARALARGRTRAGVGRPWRLPWRRAAGAFWRQAWVPCFGYERARYGLLHPETGPRQTVPLSGVLQMTNDCASPIDFSRDWEYLRPR